MTTKRHAGAPRNREIELALAIAFLGLATACAAVAANRSSPGTVAGGVFSPARPGAAQYGPDAGRTCPAGGAFKILADELAEKVREGGKPSVKGDGRLCAAADTFLGWSQAEAVPESVASFVAWHFGLPGPTPRVTIAAIETEDGKVIAERLLDSVRGFAATAVEPRFGLATERVRKDLTKVALVMQDMAVELEPTPRRLALGSQAILNGQLLGDFKDPKVLVSDAAGKLEAAPAQSGKGFKADLRCGDRPGRIQVEIRGEDGGLASVLARFPVACGRDSPTSVALFPVAKEPVDVPAKERRLFELMNVERGSAGLSALTWDDAVAGVARAASQSFSDGARRGGATAAFDLVPRLQQAGVPSLLVLENPVVAPSAEEAQARILTSPVHRSNLLNPDATHAGVGVVSSSAPGGGPLVYVTELLVRELPPADAEVVRPKLRAAIRRRRTDARAAPAASDPVLEDVAQRYAKELAAARGDLAKPRANELVAPLYKSFGTVNLVSGAKAEPLDFAEEPGVVAPGKLMGVGVAQGGNPVLGRNAVYVVVIVGARR